MLEKLATLGSLAREARRALRDHDPGRLRRCVDQSFDARAGLLTLDAGHVEMIDCARAAGAGANYAGSGGAIVAACVSDAHRARVSRELTAMGCGTLRVTAGSL